MKYIYTVVLIVVLAGISMFIGGCANKVEQIAATHVIAYQGVPAMPEGAEVILEQAFTESGIPWDKENLANITEARSAITAMGKFMKAKSELTGEVPYYSYVSSFEYFRAQYFKLQRGLDARIEVPGAISDLGALCYRLVRQQILAGLAAQQNLITMENGKINGQASQEAMEQLKQVYQLLKPLLAAAL